MSEGKQSLTRIQSGQAIATVRGLRTKVVALVLRHPSAWLFTGMVLLYLLTATYTATSIDVVAAMQPAWAVAGFGTVDLSGLPHYNLPWYFEHNGGVYSDRFPGAIFYLVPAYWVANALGFHYFTFAPGGRDRSRGRSHSCDGAAHDTVLPTRRAVWIATGFTAFGTGAWSLAAHAPWSHSMNLLLIALALLSLCRQSEVGGGLWLGLAVTTRPTMAIAALVIGWVLHSPNDPSCLSLRSASAVSPEFYCSSPITR